MIRTILRGGLRAGALAALLGVSLGPAAAAREEGGEPSATAAPEVSPGAGTTATGTAPAPSREPESYEETVRRRLSEAARAETAHAADRKATSRYYSEIGKRLYAAMRDQEARKRLELALRYDRSNTEARLLLEKVKERMSEHRSSMHAALRRFEVRERVAIQERLYELEDHYHRARRMIDAAINPPATLILMKTAEERLGDGIRQINQAFVHIDRAREIIKWMPYAIDLSEHETRLNRLQREGEDAKRRFIIELNAIQMDKAKRRVEGEMLREAEIARKKMARLMDDLAITFDRKEYKQAKKLAEEILRLDPRNYYARQMRERAAHRGHRRTEVRLFEVRHIEKEKGWRRVALASRPWAGYLLFSPDWEEKAARRGPLGRPLAPAEAWENRIRDALERRIDIQFDGQPLSEVVAYFRELTGGSFVLDQAVGGGQQVELQVRDMKAAQALRWILSLQGLGYTIRDQAVYIGQPQQLQGEITLKMYDIRDLITEVTNFAAPDFQIGLGGGPGLPAGIGPAGGAGLEPPRVVQPGALAGIIRTRISSESWGEGTSIEESQNGRLLVRQRAEVHRAIEKLLDAFRKAETIQVMIEARFIEVRDSFLEDIGIDWADLPVTHPQFASTATVPYMYPGPSAPPPGNPQSPYVHLIDPDHPLTPAAAAGGQAPFIAGFSTRLDQDYLIDIPPTSGPGIPPLGRVDNNPFGTLVGGDFIPGLYDIRLQSTNLNRRILPFGTRLGISSPPGSGQGANFAFRFLGNIQAQAILHAVARDEQADMLLAPRVTMFNNQRAHVAVSQQQPYIAGYAAGGGGGITPEIGQLLLGVILDVQPVVSHDLRYITINMRPGTARLINVVDVDVAGTTTGTGGATSAVAYIVQLPTVELRSVRTTVTLPDGGTLLLSGLMNDVSFSSDSGIPVLADIPIIGRAFSSTLKQKERRNLVILVSAHIILLNEEEENRRSVPTIQ